MPSTSELLLSNSITEPQRNLEQNPYIVDSYQKQLKPYMNVDLQLKSKSPDKHTNSMAKLDKSDLNHLMKGSSHIDHKRKKTMDGIESKNLQMSLQINQ